MADRREPFNDSSYFGSMSFYDVILYGLAVCYCSWIVYDVVAFVRRKAGAGPKGREGGE